MTRATLGLRRVSGRLEADGYFALKNEVDVTNQFRLTLMATTFTIDFTNVQGEATTHKYDMKLIWTSIKRIQQQGEWL